ncbi:hypothetical protein PHYSODRAFT_325126 [Phytophthora sojae]|uniref:Retrotransposon gag domain-containing protein n=1 Tax=Phytophthora sojae (strain P6497) TaxID=1094619 RepID=G4Z025_PHYSP|nr:hypothetical protein PHYSODRAFT_325126 [Phytophthora sojae]EGZ23965.1 hypothetical protein PHYSODRAFT_325126 [Phytophthora sojae]|eukprot:XP_009519253.1 hypothetical protein PHYSODRAFT_325126 [Phytophthora sojae]
MTASRASASGVEARPPTASASETQPAVVRPAFSFGSSSSYAQRTSAFGPQPAPGYQAPTGTSGPAVVSSAAPLWQHASVAPPGVGQYPWSSSNQALFPADTNRGDTTTWNSSFSSIDAQPTSQGETFSWGPGGPATSGFGGAYPGPTQVPEHGMMTFRPFIRRSRSLRSLAPAGQTSSVVGQVPVHGSYGEMARTGARTRLYSRLSQNEGTKAWVQQLPATIRHSWTALSDKFANEFCRSTESPVERYLRMKQDSRETPRTFLWRLNAAAVKANVDYQSPSGRRRHLNQFLKNLRDRELQLEETLRQVEAMERGLRRRPANDVQFVAPQSDDTTPTRPLQWDDDVNSDSSYQYDDEDDNDEVNSLKQEDTNVPGTVPGALTLGLEVPRERRHSSRHAPNVDVRDMSVTTACGQLHPAGQCEVLATIKRLTQRGKLQGVPDDVLQCLRQDVAPPLNN